MVLGEAVTVLASADRAPGIAARPRADDFDRAAGRRCAGGGARPPRAGVPVVAHSDPVMEPDLMVGSGVQRYK